MRRVVEDFKLRLRQCRVQPAGSRVLGFFGISLPVVQVGMVWRRGSQLTQAARDFIGLAQQQHLSRGRTVAER